MELLASSVKTLLANDAESLRGPELTGDKPATPRADVVPTRRTRWAWPSVIAAALMLGSVAAWLGGLFKVHAPVGPQRPSAGAQQPVVDIGIEGPNDNKSSIPEIKAATTGQREKSNNPEAKRRVEQLRREAISLLRHHIEVFSDDYWRKRGLSYWNVFHDFQPRLQRLVAIMEAGRIPFKEIKELVVEMKNTNVYLYTISNFEGQGTAEKKAAVVQARKYYEAAVKDLDWVINQILELNGSTIEADGPLKVGSIWTGEGGHGPKSVLLVLERAGERFTARFVPAEDPGRLLKVSGTVRNDKTAWLGKDVVAKVSVQAPDNYGTISGEVITMTWSGNGVAGSGSYVLRLKKN